MTVRTHVILTPIAGLLLVLPAAAEELSLGAAEAAAAIAPRATPRREVPLPALDFEIRATLRCEGRPVSLTLSVADVYLSFGPDSLGDEGRLEATIRVPPDQLALVIAGSSFCLGDTAQTGETLLVPGVATAQASLQCASEDGGNSMHFASAPLPLRLTCMTAEPAGQSETPPAR